MPEQIYDNILGTLGDTPLVRLNKVARTTPAQIIAKVEFFNPGGSVKDRIGIQIIEDAERAGTLKPGGTIVEATSGNTGIGLAIAAAIKGYRCIFVLADKQSPEKIQILRAFGARVIVTPTDVEPDDPRSYYSVARRMVEETPGAILANQYHNPSNPKAHVLTTGPEIWEQTGGDVRAVVIGMGTGGTITGVGRYLKERNPDIQIVGVDPVGSILHHYFYSKGEMIAGHTYITEGIGEDFVPSVYDFSVIDDVVQVTDKESFLMTRRLVREEGIFCGVSCGSAVAGAIKYARMKNLTAEDRVVVILPDSGYRYLGKVFNDEWMRENRFLDPVWVGASVETLLDRRAPQPLITAHPDDSIGSVIGKLRAHSISQLPVLDGARRLLGIIAEVDLLQFLLDDKGAGATGITLRDSGVIRQVPVVQPDTPLDSLLPLLTAQPVAIVQAGDEVRDIITKIDVIDFISKAAG
jgi:cystathionine beta-synthase